MSKETHVRLNPENSSFIVEAKAAAKALGMDMSEVAIANLLVSRGIPSVQKQFSMTVPEPKQTTKKGKQ